MGSDMLVILPLLLFSVIIHECAHGWVAERCGDDTARVMGRITLNPVPHIDMIGTIIVPLILVITGTHFFIAWAKPVPINPTRFHNYKTDVMKVSCAGCLANITVAVACGLILAVLRKVNIELPSSLSYVIVYGVYINVMLALFNLIPVPPLDGANIVYPIMPQSIRAMYNAIDRYGFVIILVLINIPPFRALLSFLVETIAGTLVGV